ncbi:MAG: hypothetical protein FJ271_29095 [Planctomycetes bacterium]|nr:hypothetical protein [Planctomycetota bacterium]
MMQHPQRGRRRGAIVPLVAISLVGLVGLTALAIDIGMIAVARSQCQNAADTAATAGCRTINGNSTVNYNFANMPAQAITAAAANKILGQSVQGDAGNYTTSGDGQSFSTGQVKIDSGIYYYVYDDNNSKNEGFKLQIPRTNTSEPYSAVRATVTNTSGLAFARVFGSTTFNTSATATSVHRPRDVIIVMDLSGSMRFQSLPGINVNSGTANPSSRSRPRTVSLNPESVYPTFGHYSDTSAAALSGSSSYSTGAEMVDPANISTTTNSGPPIIADFYQNASGVAPGSGNGAFSRAADSLASTPGGDTYLKTTNNTGASVGKTANDIVSGTDKDLKFERNGYGEYGVTFNGYTQGPGYWGKTFFIWPPDPRGSTLDPTNAANHADNGARDWRQRFFFKYNTATNTLGWLDHTNLLFSSSGSPATNSNTTPTPIIRLPNSSKNITENGASVSYRYRINYAAILYWLRNENPKPFPTQLRAGRIKYYNAIPDPSDTTLNNRWWTTATLSDSNERFWKDYIDFVLGLQGTGAGTYANVNTDPDGNNLSDVPLSALIGNGDYFPWGTVQVSAKPDRYGNALINKSGGYAIGTTTINLDTAVGFSLPENNSYVRFASHPHYPYKVTNSNVTSITLDTGLIAAIANNEVVSFHATPRSTDYNDNPYRPRHQFWFGPMTFVDYLGNYNTQRFWWPGNVHEAQCWACKVGVQAAIDDIKNNHPSDFLALAFFSNPLNSQTDKSGQYNRTVVPLGRDYQKLKDSLWFPPSTVVGTATEITPYDDDFEQVPRAKGGTAPGMGFMLAYNVLSNSTSNLRLYAQPQPQYRGGTGGLGRKGASRIVIFETDGAPNTRAYATLSGSGGDAYYQVRIKYPNKYSDSGNTEWPSSSGAYSDSAVFDVVKQICKLETDSPPGYSTVRKPALVYALGYGSLFDPANASGTQTTALNFLQSVAYYGGTASSSSGGSFPDSRRIYGTNQQRIDRIRAAFTEIMQSGVQVSLIE